MKGRSQNFKEGGGGILRRLRLRLEDDIGVDHNENRCQYEKFHWLG